MKKWLVFACFGAGTPGENWFFHVEGHYPHFKKSKIFVGSGQKRLDKMGKM